MRNHHKIMIDQNRCIDCGSCVAVCPENAITIEGFSAEEILPVLDKERIDSDLLLHVIKYPAPSVNLRIPRSNGINSLKSSKRDDTRRPPSTGRTFPI